MRQLKITKQVTNRETASLDKYLQDKLESTELAERLDKYKKLPKFKLGTLEKLKNFKYQLKVVLIL